MIRSPAIDDHNPDRNAGGMLACAPPAGRYDRQTYEPRESTGLIGAFIPVGSRVLDVGCGTGSVSCLIRDQRHATVVGIEPNAERAALCSARGIEVHPGFLTPALLATLGLFDVIVFADVLEHIADPAALLRLVRPALKADGIVIASMPNVANWTVRARLLLGRFNYSESGIMDATHLRWFTAKTVRELFERCDLPVTALEGSAGLWMKEYQWLPSPLRRRLMPWLARARPALFACQLVVRAQPVSVGEKIPA